MGYPVGVGNSRVRARGGRTDIGVAIYGRRFGGGAVDVCGGPVRSWLTVVIKGRGFRG